MRVRVQDHAQPPPAKLLQNSSHALVVVSLTKPLALLAAVPLPPPAPARAAP
jgi:hypothetical protein